MKKWITIGILALAACTFALSSAHAHGVDCTQPIEDYGDAPECMPAYPSGIIGHFPTCLFPCGPGTMELVPGCAPPGPPPGPTGFIHHVTAAAEPHFWLGCYPVPSSGLLGGLDGEPDGKVNTPAVGFSACDPSVPTDCVEVAFGGMTFDQDECYTDPVDHGVDGPPIMFPACKLFSLPFNTGSCGPGQAFLNICVDWNHDGDWNDVVECVDANGATKCVYEWSVQNAPIPIAPGCASTSSPPFQTGPSPGPTWFRISLTLDPVLPDYPWNGSASAPGGFYRGGETEDYPANVEPPVPTQSGTWGEVKATYR